MLFLLARALFSVTLTLLRCSWLLTFICCRVALQACGRHRQTGITGALRSTTTTSLWGPSLAQSLCLRWSSLAVSHTPFAALSVGAVTTTSSSLKGQASDKREGAECPPPPHHTHTHIPTHTPNHHRPRADTRRECSRPPPQLSPQRRVLSFQSREGEHRRKQKQINPPLAIVKYRYLNVLPTAATLSPAV
jgi:hypothetical protein